MEELVGKVELHTRFGSGLWRTARRECRASQLAGSIALLGDAHRQLARIDHPRTASAGRHERRTLELLQSHLRALKPQVLKVTAIADELEAAVHKRLAALEALRLAAPNGSRIEWGRPLPPLVALAVLTAIAMLMAGMAMLVAAGFWEGLGLCAPTIVAVAALTRLTTWIEFDGRSLRIHLRLFGLSLRSSAADLTCFNEVVLTDYLVDGVWCARLTLKSGGRTLQVIDGPFVAATAELARQIREWCAIAAKEATLDS